MFIGNSSLQKELSINFLNDAKFMKKILLKLHVQRKISTPCYKIPLCWAFYYVQVNNNKDVDFKSPQIMHYIFCYNNPCLISNPRTKKTWRKGIILYNIINEITTLKNNNK